MEPLGRLSLRFPEAVPVLVDAVRGLTLRALSGGDLPDLVEQCCDPTTVRFVDVPVPYGLADARRFLHDVVATGWERDEEWTWAIESERDGRRRFAGSVTLRPEPNQVAGVNFGLHPAARDNEVMSGALRLVRDYAFTMRGVRVLRWVSIVNNWPARRVAAAAGFRFDGTLRRAFAQRGQLHDAWQATLLAEDPPANLNWRDPPRLVGERVVLRPFHGADVQRVVEACSDPRTRHWLASLPSPYRPADAAAYLETTRDDAASGSAQTWCVADAGDDRCLAAINLEGFGGYHRRTEIGYWAHPDARGRGVLTEAVRLVTRYAESTLGVDSIQIRCAADNAASRHVAAAAGYRQIGVLRAAEPLGDGTINDLVIYARP